jgi:hypothetical protein
MLRGWPIQRKVDRTKSDAPRWLCERLPVLQTRELAMDLAFSLKIFPSPGEFDPVIVQEMVDLQAAETKELPKFSIAPKLLAIDLKTESLALQTTASAPWRCASSPGISRGTVIRSYYRSSCAVWTGLRLSANDIRS